MRLALLCAVTALTALAAAASAGADGATVTRFHFENSEVFATPLPECMDPNVVGIQTATDVVDGQSVENAAEGTQVHGTDRLSYRVDFPDGSYVLGGGVFHFGGTFAPSETATMRDVARETRTVYDAAGTAIGRVVIHANSHLTFHDANGNGEPDDGEITAAVDRFFFTCN